jgi:hypothetical protein
MGSSRLSKQVTVITEAAASLMAGCMTVTCPVNLPHPVSCNLGSRLICVGPQALCK